MPAPQWVTIIRNKLGGIFRSITSDPTRDKDRETSSDLSRVLIGLFWALGTGAFALLGYFFFHAAASLLWALACLASGAVVGFLFGIPRILQEDSATGTTANHDYRQKVNTNLEQISDWLTKIIVGIGLIELKNIPHYIGMLGEELRLEMNLDLSHRGFVDALIVYFSVVGFLGGYLLTRMFLAGAFSRADQEASSAIKLVRGEALSARRKAAFATSLAETKRTQLAVQGALDPSATMGQLVDQYVNIRGTQKPGPSRTEAMTQVVAKMISVASQVQSFPIEQSLTNEENAGQRLAAYAYLYAKPDSQFLNHLVKCLTTLENTPFGQYWAIQALDKILALQGLEKTDKDIANQLLSFLRKRLRKGTDRYADLSRILNVQNG